MENTIFEILLIYCTCELYAKASDNVHRKVNTTLAYVFTRGGKRAPGSRAGLKFQARGPKRPNGPVNNYLHCVIITCSEFSAIDV